MPVESNATVDSIEDRRGDEGDLQNPAGDISSGVSAEVGDVSVFTIYLDVAGAIDITVEASPNGRDDWFELQESPISFSEAGETAVQIEYNVTDIRLTGSDGTAVKAVLREVV